MNKHDLLTIALLITVYLLLLFTFKRTIFTYTFDNRLIDRYYLSQDITHEVNGRRLFLSDSDIYMATGYIYAKGSDPALNNFEHPPLVKYLFGYSALIFNNPYIAQIALGASLIAALYILTRKMKLNRLTGVITCLLFVSDPLFLLVSSETLLDIGQTLFLVLYFISMFYYGKNYILQGVLLGLFAGTKFWIPTLFFIVLFTIYKLYKKEFNRKYFVAHLIVGFLAYSALYLRSFILGDGYFNIFWHILKTVKYRFQHNTALYFGASLIMYTTSYVKTWWGDHSIISTRPWTLLWPISLIITIWQSYRLIAQKNITEKLLIVVIPLGYLLYLGVQAPFTRYFLPILPFSYIVLAECITRVGKKYIVRNGSS